MARGIAVVAITAAFGLLFVGLRSLPDAQCGFLHYVEVERPDGTIEFCATNHAGFVDLTRLSYPVRMEIETDGPLQAGRPVAVELELLSRGGMPILPHELAVTHTEKLHLMIVDPSLGDYFHVHPEAVGASGRYRFEFTPRKAGSYRLYAEMVPVRTRRQVIADAVLEVPGDPLQPVFDGTREPRVGDLRFVFDGALEEVRPGRDMKVRLEVTGADGGEVVLEELMGARAHLVAFDHRGRGLAHMHPVGSLLGADPADAPLEFLVNLPYPGDYRIWAQVKVAGRERFAPIDVRVSGRG